MNRRGSEPRPIRSTLGGAILAIFYAFAPSAVPDWRADPGFRTVAVLPVGEPMTSFDKAHRS